MYKLPMITRKLIMHAFVRLTHQEAYLFEKYDFIGLKLQTAVKFLFRFDREITSNVKTSLSAICCQIELYALSVQ